MMHIHRQSAYLIGRDPQIADISVLHPSCSKQHAALQYRLTPKNLPDGTTVKKVRPYIMDLGSANGTYLNDERIEPQRYFVFSNRVENFGVLGMTNKLVPFLLFLFITKDFLTFLICSFFKTDLATKK